MLRKLFLSFSFSVIAMSSFQLAQAQTQTVQLATPTNVVQTSVVQLQNNIQSLTNQVAALTQQNAQLKTVNDLYQKQLQVVQEYLPVSLPKLNTQVQQTQKAALECIQGNCSQTTDAYDQLSSNLFSPTWNTIVTVAGLIAVFFLIMLLVELRKKAKQPLVITDNEHVYQTIAGENVQATKLDLARAYMDMHELEKAKDLLTDVVANGDAEQQIEAKRLLEELK